jgi:hypothetical protein
VDGCSCRVTRSGKEGSGENRCAPITTVSISSISTLLGSANCNKTTPICRSEEAGQVRAAPGEVRTRTARRWALLGFLAQRQKVCQSKPHLKEQQPDDRHDGEGGGRTGGAAALRRCGWGWASVREPESFVSSKGEDDVAIAPKVGFGRALFLKFPAQRAQLVDKLLRLVA